MIPLRDDVPSRTFPFVNYAIIALNFLVFFGELGMGADLERFFYKAAVVPVVYAGRDHVFELRDLAASVLDSELRTRVLLSMFMHGGWMHLLGNMLYLWIFGDNVEDRCGHFRYLVFYLLCGYAATWGHIFSDPTSRVPSLGASGAIAGVLGAYITLYPRARVVALVPIIFYMELMQLPAIFVLGLWALQQFIFGVTSLAGPQGGGGVAWFAHVGGFIAGLVLVHVFKSRKHQPPPRDAWWEDHYRGRRVRGW